MAGSATVSSGKSSSLKCGVRSGRARFLRAVSVHRRRRARVRMPIMSSRRAAHKAARRSMPKRAKRVGLRQPLDGEAGNAGDRRQPFDRGKAVAARGDEFFQFVFVEPVQ